MIGKKAKTFGVVYKTYPHHLGKGVNVQVIEYQYEVQDSIYRSSYQAGIVKSPKRKGDVLSIEYLEKSPEISEMVGFYRDRPKAVPEYLFPFEWTQYEMYRPTVVHQKTDSFLLQEIKSKSRYPDYESGGDDNWYHSKVLMITDSFDIPIITTESRYLNLKSKLIEVDIIKDTTTFHDSYIYFDGDSFIVTDAIELPEEILKTMHNSGHKANARKE